MAYHDDNNRERDFWRDQLAALIIIIGVVLVTIFLMSRASAESLELPKITSIYWSDADSGRINGNIKFRLNSVDAPETGGVGAAIGGAKCELERKRGFASKEWIVGFTKDKELEIANDYGLDKYDRRVLDLSASHEDVGQFGVKVGHLKPWPHKERKALAKKPDWCSEVN